MNLLQGTIYWPIIVRGKYAGALQIFSYQSASSVKHAVALQTFSYQSASGVKYAVALQYLLSPIRFKAETAVALQEQIFVFPPIRLVVKICLRSLQRRSPTHLLYEKAICKNVQKLKQANSWIIKSLPLLSLS